MRCLLAVLLIAACGGDDAVTPDAATTTDAPAVDAAPSACLVPTTFGDLGARTGTAMQGIPSSLSVTIDVGPPRDSFFVRLDTGDGVFANGLATGTYPLTGAEIDYDSCGLCVNIIADIVAGQGPSKFYFATGGSVTLTATTPPAGSLTDVTFTEVTSGGAPVGSGCTTTIAAMSFGP